MCRIEYVAFDKSVLIMSENVNSLRQSFQQFLRVALAATLTLSGCSDRDATTITPERRTELALGTAVTISVHDTVSEETLDAVFARVDEIEAKMSASETDYSSTEVLSVNRAAGRRPVQVSPDTFGVVVRALEMSRRTAGAFDVSVNPLVKLWGIGTDYARVPTDDEIRLTADLVDYQRVRIDPYERTVYLPTPGMGIDVGGIAKGYAADEAAQMLRDAGVQHALLDFGGNIYALGYKPDGSSWRIGIQVPFSTRGEYLGIVTVNDAAVVTSGVYERYFEVDGVLYHHILDTRTGRPARNGLLSVTILTAESMEADALSTAVFALGLERGYRFVENFYGVEAIFVTEQQDIYLTSGMDRYFSPSGETFTVIDGTPAEGSAAGDGAR